MKWQNKLLFIFICLVSIINIVGASNPILMNYAPNNTIGFSGVPVLFTDSSTNATNWSWFFGDEDYSQPFIIQNASGGFTRRGYVSGAALSSGEFVFGGGINTTMGIANNETWITYNKGLQWTQINSSSGWTTRYGHSIVSIPSPSSANDVLVLVGGYSPVFGFLNDTWISTDKGAHWTLVNSTPGWETRYLHSVTVTSDNAIILTGGLNSFTTFNDTWKSTDQGSTWVRTASSASWQPRYAHMSSAIGNDIFIYGGANTSVSGTKIFGDIWKSQDYGATWSLVLEKPPWVSSLAGTLLAMPDNSLVYGGGPNETFWQYTWRSKDKGVTWTVINTTPMYRQLFASGVLNDGSIILVAGLLDQDLNSTTRFSPMSSILQSPTHVYTASGTFPVTLVVNSTVSKNTSSKYLIANYNKTIPIFSADVTNPVLAGSPVTFTDSSTNTSTWSWFFGDENYNQPWKIINLTPQWVERYAHSFAVFPNGHIVLGNGIGTNIKGDTWISTDGGKIWTNITPNPKPHSDRYNMEFVVLNDSSLLSVGGADTGTIYNDVWMSNNEGITWTLVNGSGYTPSRLFYALAKLPNDHIVITGGVTLGGASFLNDTWRSTDKGVTWQLMNASSGWAKREYHNLIATNDGKLVLFGGYNASVTPWYNDTWMSSDEGATWTLMNATSGWTPRLVMGSTIMPDNSILLTGGFVEPGVGATDSWRTTDYGSTWTKLNSTTQPWNFRWHHKLGVLPNGSVVMTAGYNGSPLSDVFMFNPSGSNTQNPVHTYSNSGIYNVSLRVANSLFFNITLKSAYETIYSQAIADFLANRTGSNTYPVAISFSTTNTSDNATQWNWSFGDGTWQNGTSRTVTHTYSTNGTFTIIEIASNPVSSATKTKTNYIVISNQTFVNFTQNATIGSTTQPILFTDTSTNDTQQAWFFGDESYTKSWTLQNASGVWGARTAPCLVSLPNGNLILTGGSDSAQNYNDTWKSTNNGTTWSLVNTSSGWPARQLQKCVVTSDGSIVLFGGVGTTYYNDTWRSTDEGVTWTRVNASSGWVARAYITASILSNDHILLMGGFDGLVGTYLNDTWKSVDSGSTWSRVNASSGWTVRAAPFSATLPNDNVLLMGGDFNPGTGGISYNDTWVSSNEGSTWTLINSNSGWVSRFASTSNTMPDGSVVILGGAINGSSSPPIVVNDSWRTVNGGYNWTLTNLSNGWTPRAYIGSAVLPNGKLILSGGYDIRNAIPYNDTWVFDVIGSSTKNPTHIYTTAGFYNVSLLVSNQFDFNSTTRSNLISIYNLSLTTNFTANSTLGNITPFVVNFTDLSTLPSITNWNWSVGDGRWFNFTSAQAAQRNITYQYAVAGLYTVNLTTNGTPLNSSKTVVNYINLTSEFDTNVSSWLHMNGTDKSATFADEAGIAWTNGNTFANITTAIFKYGGASGNFTGTTPKSITAASVPAFNFSTGDFTIEFWANVSATANNNIPIITKAPTNFGGGWGFVDVAGTSSNNWVFYMGNYGTGANRTSPLISLPVGTWNHVAIERRSGTIYVYVNGMLNATNSVVGSGSYDTSNIVRIGYGGAGPATYNGYLDEFRINRIARWWSNFTPPYDQYQGDVRTNFPDINPNSTMRYKTDPTGFAYIGNTTPRNRTLQIQCITYTNYASGELFFDNNHVFVKPVALNTSTYNDMTLISSVIDNTLGSITFNISRAAGLSPGTSRVSILDYNAIYYNLSEINESVENPDVGEQWIGTGSLNNGTTAHFYPVHFFIPTPVSYLPWNLTNNFTINNLTTIVGLPVNFTDDSYLYNSYPSSWNWSFGDGVSVNNTVNQNITHAYSTSGFKTVTLTISMWQNFSIFNTSSKTILVYDPITTDFTQDYREAYVPPSINVSFNDTSLNATWWNWSFHDGTWFNTTNSALKNVTRIYSSGGNFTINLTSSFEGADAHTKNSWVNTTLILAPVASFTLNPTAGLAPLFVQGNDTTVQNTSQWNWSWGDGTWTNGSLDSWQTVKNASHTYINPGSFPVYLIVSNTNATSQAAPQTVTVYGNVLVGFTANITTGYIPLTVIFNVTHVNDNATAWDWDFGDGTAHGTTQNVTHTYVTNGSKTIVQTASNPFDLASIVNVSYITPNYIPIITMYTINPTHGFKPLAVSFTSNYLVLSDADASNGAPTTWTWYFGDGNTTTLHNPVYTYPNSGLYSPMLVVGSSVSGNINISTCVNCISITGAPVPTYNISPAGPPGNIDIVNSSGLQEWMYYMIVTNKTGPWEFPVIGFASGVMRPFTDAFNTLGPNGGSYVYLLLWGLFIMMVWRQSGKITMPALIAVITAGAWGLLFPESAQPWIQLLLCAAIASQLFTFFTKE